jgi:hypothetical protein
MHKKISASPKNLKILSTLDLYFFLVIKDRIGRSLITSNGPCRTKIALLGLISHFSHLSCLWSLCFDCPIADQGVFYQECVLAHNRTSILIVTWLCYVSCCQLVYAGTVSSTCKTHDTKSLPPPNYFKLILGFPLLYLPNLSTFFSVKGASINTFFGTTWIN